MGKIKNGKLLYHLTKLSNLDSIIQNGLLSRRELLERNSYFSDVADQEIIKKRHLFDLDKYIPFHFHPYSSFDVAVKNKYSNDDFIYLCIKREYALKHGFLILLRHPLSGESPALYKYSEGIQKIDWDKMEHSSTESDEIKNIRMAECLASNVISFEDLCCLYVKNDKQIQNKIADKLRRLDLSFVHVNTCKWL